MAVAISKQAARDRGAESPELLFMEASFDSTTSPHTPSAAEAVTPQTGLNRRVLLSTTGSFVRELDADHHPAPQPQPLSTPLTAQPQQQRGNSIGGDAAPNPPTQQDLESSLGRLTQELAEKQRLLARLAHEVDQHRAALHRVGEEVVQTRRRNEELAEQNAVLRAETEAEADSIVLEPRVLFGADRGTVMQAHGACGRGACPGW